MTFQGVAESPMLIDDIDFSFNDEVYNEIKAKEVLGNQTKKIVIETPILKVFKVGDSKKGELVGIPNGIERVDYYVNYKTYNFPPIGRAVAQVKLWRMDDGNAIGITKAMFFDYLLPKFGTIVSDNQQTKDGERFWRSRLTEANIAGLKIGLLLTKTQKVIWYDGSIHLPKWFKEVDGWQENEEHMSKRFVIVGSKI